MSALHDDARAARRWLVFRIAGHDYALEAADVREVHAAPRPLPLAGTVDWFLGTSTLRGRVVPVTSLGRWLGVTGHESIAALGIEIAVHGRAYLLAVPEVRQALEDIDDDDARATQDTTSALAARGVPSMRRRVGGRMVECFAAPALVASGAFGAIAQPA